MSILKILNNKDTEASEKLEQVAELVSTIRKTYGNTEKVIKVPDVDTVYGVLPFTQVEDESKVELLITEAMHIKTLATAFMNNHSGVVLTKKLEELISTSPYFANVSAGNDFEYL